MISAATKVRSLPPCGGGLGRGVAQQKVLIVDAHQVPNRKNPRVAPLSLPLPRKGGGNGETATAETAKSTPSYLNPRFPTPGTSSSPRLNFALRRRITLRCTMLTC